MNETYFDPEVYDEKNLSDIHNPNAFSTEVPDEITGSPFYDGASKLRRNFAGLLTGNSGSTPEQILGDENNQIQVTAEHLQQLKLPEHTVDFAADVTALKSEAMVQALSNSVDPTQSAGMLTESIIAAMNKVTIENLNIDLGAFRRGYENPGTVSRETADRVTYLLKNAHTLGLVWGTCTKLMLDNEIGSSDYIRGKAVLDSIVSGTPIKPNIALRALGQRAIPLSEVITGKEIVVAKGVDGAFGRRNGGSLSELTLDQHGLADIVYADQNTLDMVKIMNGYIEEAATVRETISQYASKAPAITEVMLKPHARSMVEASKEAVQYTNLAKEADKVYTQVKAELDTVIKNGQEIPQELVNRFMAASGGRTKQNALLIKYQTIFASTRDEFYAADNSNYSTIISATTSLAQVMKTSRSAAFTIGKTLSEQPHIFLQAALTARTVQNLLVVNNMNLSGDVISKLFSDPLVRENLTDTQIKLALDQVNKVAGSINPDAKAHLVGGIVSSFVVDSNVRQIRDMAEQEAVEAVAKAKGQVSV